MKKIQGIGLLVLGGLAVFEVQRLSQFQKGYRLRASGFNISMKGGRILLTFTAHLDNNSESTVEISGISGSIDHAGTPLIYYSSPVKVLCKAGQTTDIPVGAYLDPMDLLRAMKNVNLENLDEVNLSYKVDIYTKVAFFLNWPVTISGKDTYKVGRLWNEMLEYIKQYTTKGE